MKRLTFTIVKPNRPHKSHLPEYAKRFSSLQITVSLVVDPPVELGRGIKTVQDKLEELREAVRNAEDILKETDTF